ncbi:crotonase [Mycobacterium sp. CBMA271]|uniref:enoyl-CoA hydratase/isomerase family protein n=1 Tax=unclassified Mycobacteroides TaxID=2618759 RepID=UPI00132B5534|nr:MULTISPECIES: enoyl-CoA hydratase-related protein [unclassified Mycobacteroides]MUM18075.1 crotonase [Mycobacteroides sp. CBMA 326]MUM23441.1 crotonase [Mycobacteroides sp. CBMA 271]
MTELRTEIREAVAVLTLHGPTTRNAFTTELGRQLGAAYRRLDDDPAVRVIVLTGTPPAFCSGAEISAGAETFAAPSNPEFSASPVRPTAFELNTPVIAAVNGHAIGIGMTLALHADIRILAEEGRYAIPQVRFGVAPDAMAHWTLPRLVGTAVAAELLLTGAPFSAQRAVETGLANRCLPASQVLDAALVMARDIATNVAPQSAALTKRLLWDAQTRGMSADAVAERETTDHLQLMGSADAVEGPRAFREGRAPRWRARSHHD